MGWLSWFWSEHVWLPVGTTWSDLKSNETMRYPDVNDFQLTILGGLILLVYRILLESFVFVPIGWLTGYVTTPLFERSYMHISGGFMGKTKLKRVSECAFRWQYYIFAWIGGFSILRHEPQFYDVTECWRNWPHHNVSDSIWWYYMIETSFYWCLMFGTLFIDVRRADFYQMLTHHAITIGLLFISWSMNMTRVGALILLIHDTADIFIEAAKVFRYARWHGPLTILSVFVFLSWVSTRLVIYPFWVLRSIWFDSPHLLQEVPYRWSDIFGRPIIVRILMILLSLLLVLHVFWTIVLIRCAIGTGCGGEMVDVRENSDVDEPDEGIEEKIERRKIKPTKKKTN